jgi:hypothetical protein
MEGEAIQEGTMAARVLCHVKDNRIEYAVFTMLLYTLDAVGKLKAYGTGLCM